MDTLKGTQFSAIPSKTKPASRAMFKTGLKNIKIISTRQSSLINGDKAGRERNVCKIPTPCARYRIADRMRIFQRTISGAWKPARLVKTTKRSDEEKIHISKGGARKVSSVFTLCKYTVKVSEVFLVFPGIKRANNRLVCLDKANIKTAAIRLPPLSKTLLIASKTISVLTTIKSAFC